MAGGAVDRVETGWTPVGLDGGFVALPPPELPPLCPRLRRHLADLRARGQAFLCPSPAAALAWLAVAAAGDALCYARLGQMLDLAHPRRELANLMRSWSGERWRVSSPCRHFRYHTRGLGLVVLAQRRRGPNVLDYLAVRTRAPVPAGDPGAAAAWRRLDRLAATPRAASRQAMIAGPPPAAAPAAARPVPSRVALPHQLHPADRAA